MPPRRSDEGCTRSTGDEPTSAGRRAGAVGVQLEADVGDQEGASPDDEVESPRRFDVDDLGRVVEPDRSGAHLVLETAAWTWPPRVVDVDLTGPDEPFGIPLRVDQGVEHPLRVGREAPFAHGRDDRWPQHAARRSVAGSSPSTRARTAAWVRFFTPSFWYTCRT